CNMVVPDNSNRTCIVNLCYLPRTSNNNKMVLKIFSIHDITSNCVNVLIQNNFISRCSSLFRRKRQQKIELIVVDDMSDINSTNIEYNRVVWIAQRCP